MDETTPEDRALSEAERWFARRRGALAGVEARAFEHWRADPANAGAYARTERTWERLGALEGDPALEAMLSSALAATARPRPRMRWYAGAAAIAAAACLVLALSLGPPPPAPVPAVHYATTPAHGRTVTLADGSELQLDVDTAVSVQMLPDRRNIRLQRGQAMFRVAHDAARPFRVAAGDGSVTALGTRFLVRHMGAMVRVTLFEGSVAVERDGHGESLRLSPGQQASYGRDTPMTVRTVDLEVAGSWTRGRLLFRATPLAEVVAEVNRYAATPLHLRDPSLAGIPVSGTFPVGDSRSVALALEALLPVRIDLGNPDEIAIERR